MIVYNAATNQIQCIQNPATIAVMLDEDNDDVNVIPLLPLEYRLHLLFRGADTILPRMIMTPSIYDVESFKPVQPHVQYDLYNRETFLHFVYTKQEAAQNYGRKMVLKGSLNGFRPIIHQDVEYYYRMAQQLLIEREIVARKPARPNFWSKMVKVVKMTPHVATMKRQIWHETVAESDFIHFCQTSTNKTKEFWSDRKVIDCRGALVEWKEVIRSKLNESYSMYRPIEDFKSKNECPTNVALRFLQKVSSSNEKDKVTIYENDLIQLAIQSIKSYQKIQQEKIVFETLEEDDELLNTRCLPEIFRAMKINRRAVRIKELVEKETQAELWETEWTDNWSNISIQTDE